MTITHPYCIAAPAQPLHRLYHDEEYGVPQRADTVLFERLVQEINQAGLSWITVLRKRDAFTAAFQGWDIDRIAAFGPPDIERLMADAGIIRNRRKIDAAIENARRVRVLRDGYGSFAGWLDAHHPLDKPSWVRLFGKTFVFTGGEIVGEFLMSLGYLPGAHDPECPRYRDIMALSPPWAAR